MPLEPSPELVALFGSATRVRTLAALATAPGPITGYRIARMCGISPTKTYAELYRLRSANVVREQPTATGRRGWLLSDPDVGALLRHRARFPSADSARLVPPSPSRIAMPGRPKWQDPGFANFPKAAPPLIVPSDSEPALASAEPGLAVVRTDSRRRRG
jgi:hypothetical protein